jgi:hypothetical protein
MSDRLAYWMEKLALSHAQLQFLRDPTEANELALSAEEVSKLLQRALIVPSSRPGKHYRLTSHAEELVGRIEEDLEQDLAAD